MHPEQSSGDDSRLHRGPGNAAGGGDREKGIATESAIVEISGGRAAAFRGQQSIDPVRTHFGFLRFGGSLRPSGKISRGCAGTKKSGVALRVFSAGHLSRFEWPEPLPRNPRLRGQLEKSCEPAGRGARGGLSGGRARIADQSSVQRSQRESHLSDVPATIVPRRPRNNATS